MSGFVFFEAGVRFSKLWFGAIPLGVIVAVAFDPRLASPDGKRVEPAERPKNRFDERPSLNPFDALWTCGHQCEDNAIVGGHSARVMGALVRDDIWIVEVAQKSISQGPLSILGAGDRDIRNADIARFLPVKLKIDDLRRSHSYPHPLRLVESFSESLTTLSSC